jgi:predicted dehydrogenase
MALLRFESGAIGNLESGWLLPTTEPAGLSSRFDIVGTKGCMYIGNVNETLFICTKDGCRHPDVSYWPVLRGQAIGALRESMTHWLTCLLTDKDPIVGAKEGRLAVQLVLAIQESCRLGQPVEFS